MILNPLSFMRPSQSKVEVNTLLNQEKFGIFFSGILEKSNKLVPSWRIMISRHYRNMEKSIDSLFEETVKSRGLKRSNAEKQIHYRITGWRLL